MYLPTVFNALYEAFVKSNVKSIVPEGETPDSFWQELNALAPQYTAIKEAPFNPNDFKKSFLLILFSMVGYFDRVFLKVSIMVFLCTYINVLLKLRRKKILKLFLILLK
jgi:hypothetical protein